jgi:2-polyprenyl-3-methyl-5-hydroxy-6-metoxy-1,4-benzoquinol methylase
MENIKGTDIYLLDQILKGTYLSAHKILDAGCGSGRNMRWFAQNGYSVYGCDIHAEVVQEAVQNTGLSADKFKVSAVEKMPYTIEEFDHIICNAVLHFANSESHFLKMMEEMYRILKEGGTLFIRMTSTFGLPQNYRSLGGGRYFLADGSERFLLTEKLLEAIEQIGFVKIEPVKSVLVEELRSMTTLVLRKG